MALFGRQPIPQSYAKFPDTFDTANTCGKVGTEESTVGGLVRKATHSTKPQVDRARGQLPTLEVGSISEDHDSAESKAGLRAIPVNELVNRMAIPALSVRAG
jgi:hypothetical protein